MYANILLPVAFDDDMNVAKSVSVAKALSAEGAAVTLLHVFEILPGYAMEYVPKDMVEATRQGVLESMQAAIADLPRATAQVTEGSPGRAILDWANQHGTDLIVMPSHDPSMGDILWGSTAGYVVRHAHCAVHVLR